MFSNGIEKFKNMSFKSAKAELGMLFIIVFFPIIFSAQAVLNIKESGNSFQVAVSAINAGTITFPEEGLWSMATGWENDWPADCHHAKPDKIQEIGEWKILSGWV